MTCGLEQRASAPTYFYGCRELRSPTNPGGQGPISAGPARSHISPWQDRRLPTQPRAMTIPETHIACWNPELDPTDRTGTRKTGGEAHAIAWSEAATTGHGRAMEESPLQMTRYPSSTAKKGFGFDKLPSFSMSSMLQKYDTTRLLSSISRQDHLSPGPRDKPTVAWVTMSNVNLRKRPDDIYGRTLLHLVYPL